MAKISYAGDRCIDTLLCKNVAAFVNFRSKNGLKSYKLINWIANFDVRKRSGYGTVYERWRYEARNIHRVSGLLVLVSRHLYSSVGRYHGTTVEPR